MFRKTKVYPYEEVNLKNAPVFTQAHDNLKLHLTKLVAEGGNFTDYKTLVTIIDMSLLHIEAKMFFNKGESMTSAEFNLLKCFVAALIVPNRGHDGHYALSTGCFVVMVDIHGDQIIRFDSSKVKTKTTNGLCEHFFCSIVLVPDLHILSFCINCWFLLIVKKEQLTYSACVQWPTKVKAKVIQHIPRST